MVKLAVEVGTGTSPRQSWWILKSKDDMPKQKDSLHSQQKRYYYYRHCSKIVFILQLYYGIEYALYST